MLKKFLKSLEDPTKILLGPNYRLLKKLGLILPKDKLNTIIYILIHQLFFLFVITQYIELVVIRRSDLDLVLNNLKITLQCSLCVIKVNAFLFSQDKWKQVIDYVTEADEYERNNRDTTKCKMVEGYTKYCRLITYSYWLLVLTTACAVASTPLIIISSENYRAEPRNKTISFPHFFSSWMPFDKNHSPGCWITVLWHIAICVYGASVVAANDTITIVIMVFFGGKLELLRERSKEIFGSAGDKLGLKETRKTMQELHNIHVQLTKHLRLFNSVTSPVMFFYVVVVSLILCASAFQLTSVTNAAQKILMGIYFIFSISQLFIFCWHSNDTIHKSQNLVYGTYESEWWAAHVHQRKHLHILSGQFRITHVFEAGPFTNLTLAACVTILKGTYSFYTILRK